MTQPGAYCCALTDVDAAGVERLGVQKAKAVKREEYRVVMTKLVEDLRMNTARYAFDGRKTLYTLEPLPEGPFEVTIGKRGYKVRLELLAMSLVIWRTPRLAVQLLGL